MKTLLLSGALVVVALVVLGVGSAAAGPITMRSGQVNGSPGSAGMLDTNITFITSSGEMMPLRTLPFTAADFSAARIGAQAVVINANGPWLPSLSCDPDARWINSASSSGYGWPARSALYALQFNVPYSTWAEAPFTLCWAVDDRLGDQNPCGTSIGQNQIGVYLNGTALGPAFACGSFTSQTTASMNVQNLIQPGTNWLYVYQRDVNGAQSGVIFHATIDFVGCCCTGQPISLLTTEADCAMQGGWWAGPGVPCDPNPCPRACCDLFGTCTLISRINCTFPSVWHLEWMSCSPNPCPQYGCCCTGELVSYWLTEAECAMRGGWWAGPGVLCDPNPCPPPVPVERTTWGQIKSRYR